MLKSTIFSENFSNFVVENRKNITIMKRVVFGVIAIMILVIGASCDRKEVLDPEEDYILIRAFESARHQSIKGIDIEALENCATLYEKDRVLGKVCLCDALIGCKLYFDGDYDKSLIHLKRAEANLQYCDSMASFVYTYIAKNTMTTDTILALNYAHKALEKDLEYNNLRRLPYSYLDLSLLTKGDTAQYHLRKSLNLFDENKKIMANALFGKHHALEMDADSVIKYVKPYYEKINYVGYAYTLVDAYIRKEMLDSANQYMQHLASRKDFENDYFLCKAKIMAVSGEYKESCKWWKIAYERNEEEWKFMMNQRLSAINAEYDLLNEELVNEKEKLTMMRVYVLTLSILVVVLLIAIVVIFRYKKNIGALEVDIERSKERFNMLFERYKEGYEVDKDTIFADARMNLQTMNDDYPKLTKTDLAIVWLIFMNCNRDMVCKMLNISSRYYYNRRSIIQRELKMQIDDSRESQKRIEQLVKKYIVKRKKRR